MTRGATAAALAAALTVAVVGGAADARAAEPTVLLHMRTIPAIPGATFALGPRILRADRQGVVSAKVKLSSAASGRLRPQRVRLGPNVLAVFKQWHGHLGAEPGGGGGRLAVKMLSATYDVYYRVRLRFTDNLGRPAPGPIDRLVLRASTGVVVSVVPRRTGNTTVWLWGRRVVPYHDSLQVKPVYWVVDRVATFGTNVVNRSQEKIFPSRSTRRLLDLHLLYFRAHIRSRDLLFRISSGSKVAIRFPDGRTHRVKLSHGSVLLPALPRGRYQVKPIGLGIGFWTPVELSRDQVIDVGIVTYLDLAVIVLLVGFVAFALAAARRPMLRRRARSMLGLPVALRR